MEAPRVLLGVTGSIAAYKAVTIVRLLRKAGLDVQVGMTASAQRFVTPLTFAAVSGRSVLRDLFPESMCAEEASGITHVETAHERSLILIAPASANFLARMAAGLADDVLLATVLASRAPVVVAPAMESGMWDNVATQTNIATLLGRGVEVIEPQHGALASGREGVGRMAEPEHIASRMLDRMQHVQDLAKERVLVTGGPTWEPLDPVRVLTNRSTGTMAIALAEAAAARGAVVRLVLGPTHLAPAPHPALAVTRVETALEMKAAAERCLEGVTLLVGAAAVSDFRPSETLPRKLKRAGLGPQVLPLTENPDILADLSSRLRSHGSRPLVVGFAAETEDLLPHARAKMARKGCDLMVANLVGKDLGFGQGLSEVVVVSADQEPPVHSGRASKTALAHFILDQVVRVRKQAAS